MVSPSDPNRLLEADPGVPPRPPVRLDTVLAGGGEMGERLRAFDWGSTPLGPIAGWPSSLKSSLSLILHSQMPMWIGWGADLFFFYNDAYVQVLSAAKHPWALGRPASEVWREIWNVCGPLANQVLYAAEAPFVEDVRLFMNRGDRVEEVYYSFSYSPIRDESGVVAGLFCPNTEVTAKLLHTRRLRTLSELAARSLVARTLSEACASAAETLGRNPDDLPFALLYLADGEELRLDQAVGLARATSASPERVGPAWEGPWPLRSVFDAATAEIVEVTANDVLPRGLADQPVAQAVVLPITAVGQERPLGVMVAGVNPTRPLDPEYRTFYDLVAAQVATAVQHARAGEEERRRALMLAELDRAKTTFFSNVSHEFRTPLTLMIGPTEDALASPDGALRGDALAAVYRNELRLLKLVNALLDFSRLEAGKLAAAVEPLDLAELTVDLVSGFRSAIERAGLRLELALPRLPSLVPVDRALWEKIVLNLLSNALKFTLEGTIRVTLEAKERTVELAVADTGVGIPPEEIPRVFERFHRIENPRARTHEGSGIGLALVQELTRLHGGDVTVESEVGRGTTFRVSIPRGDLPLAKPGRRRANTLSERSAFVEEIERPPTPIPIPTDGGEGHILVADDNADMRDYLVRLLASQWRVTVVRDGEEALAAARRELPDVVVTDVMMPRLDGFALLQALRADERTGRIPVIMLSARAGDEARVDGLAAGADDYLVKPFSARELLARVRTQVTLARLRRQEERELRELTGLQARLRATLEASTIGTYAWDVVSNAVEGDEGARRLFGFAPGEGGELAHWTDRVHEADRPRWLEALARCAAEGTDFHEEYRIVLPDGALRWVLDKGRMGRDEAGASRRLTGAVVDITEQKRLAEVALAANRAKDEFLAMLGHELRNPLAPIVTALQLIKLRGQGVGKEHETIERQVHHLTRLVDDLLDISRVTRGLIELKSEPVALGDVVAKALEIASPLMERKGHFVSVSVPRTLHVQGDPVRLAQIFANLLINAARYTPERGRIEVQAVREGASAMVRVADNGIGIAPELRGRIFDLFFQGQGTGRDRGGLGIGLSLVRTLVKMHGGDVSATSAGEGQGSEFTVELPLTSAPPSTAEVAHPDAPALEPVARRLVLLVDDNVDAVELLGMALERLGYDVVVAHDGAEALALLPGIRPEVAVLDIGLPVMDGYELARRLRSGGLVDCRLIALTGYGQEQDRARSLAAGFDVHLVKPVDLAVLARELAVGKTPRVARVDVAHTL